jgi:hypothetical protein
MMILPIRRSEPGVRPNATWQRDLSMSYNKIGAMLAAQGDLDQALKSLRDGSLPENGWPRPTPPMQPGSGVGRWLTTRSVKCWWRRAS